MTPTLLVDGDCGFCMRAGSWLRGALPRPPRVTTWQAADLAALGVTEEACRSALQYVDARGRVHAGERAVAAVLRSGGGGWPMAGWLLGLPGVIHAAGLAYRWTARNRHRLPGGTAACVLDDPGT